MKLLIAYDVCTADKEGQKRLRRVAQACEDYGQRVQKSVFECILGDSDWLKFRQRLLKEVDLIQDSLRFYFLSADTVIEHHGNDKPMDLQGPLII